MKNPMLILSIDPQRSFKFTRSNSCWCLLNGVYLRKFFVIPNLRALTLAAIRVVTSVTQPTYEKFSYLASALERIV
jgi:hypothetical protein